MASLIATSFLCLFTVVASDPIMRKDGSVQQSSRQASVALHVGAAGTLLDLAPKLKAKEGLETCNSDFPLGQIGSNSCADSGDAPAHHPIDERELCQDAAEEAGITVNSETFTLVAEMAVMIQHPMGCFKHACVLAINNTVEHAHQQVTPNPTDATAAANGLANEAAANGTAFIDFEALTGDCYFFNPIGYKPGPEASPPQPALSTASTLVCMRPKITKGANDTNGGCKTGYDVIYDEQTCLEAAGCMGFSPGDRCSGQFRSDVLNNSQYDEFPHGCFIKKGDGCVYFNKKPMNWPAKPARPIGVNLCNVTNVTTAASVGASAGEVAADNTAADNGTSS